MSAEHAVAGAPRARRIWGGGTCGPSVGAVDRARCFPSTFPAVRLGSASGVGGGRASRIPDERDPPLWMAHRDELDDLTGKLGLRPLPILGQPEAEKDRQEKRPGGAGEPDEEPETDEVVPQAERCLFLVFAAAS